MFVPLLWVRSLEVRTYVNSLFISLGNDKPFIAKNDLKVLGDTCFEST